MEYFDFPQRDPYYLDEDLPIVKRILDELEHIDHAQWEHMLSMNYSDMMEILRKIDRTQSQRIVRPSSRNSLPLGTQSQTMVRPSSRGSLPLGTATPQAGLGNYSIVLLCMSSLVSFVIANIFSIDTDTNNDFVTPLDKHCCNL